MNRSIASLIAYSAVCLLALAPRNWAFDERPQGSSSRSGSTEIQSLHQRLALINERIASAKLPQELMSLEMEQARLLLRLGVFTQGSERDASIKAGIDCAYNAAILSSENQPAAYEWLI